VAWLVDTCVLIDVAEADPRFGKRSARCLDDRLSEGLVISPITYAELGPVFEGSRELQDEFLSEVGISIQEAWTHTDTITAHRAWWSHVQRRRRKAAPKRPLADALIGAMACRFAGLVTRNPADFAELFPDLVILDPMKS
jgi:predicted nucleic acid-binding protein